MSKIINNRNAFEIIEVIYQLLGELNIVGSTALGALPIGKGGGKQVRDIRGYPEPKDIDLVTRNPTMTTRTLCIALEAVILVETGITVRIESGKDNGKYDIPHLARRFVLHYDGGPPIDLLFMRCKETESHAVWQSTVTSPLMEVAVKKVNFSTWNRVTLFSDTVCRLAEVAEKTLEVVYGRPNEYDRKVSERARLISKALK
jgi:hypothetical protein